MREKMSLLNQTLEIRETCQIYRVLLDQLLKPYINEAGKKTLLSREELQAAILIYSLTRNSDGDLYISKGAFLEKLDCGKNEHTRILKNLCYAGIIEKNNISNDFTYAYNNRYIHIHLPQKWYTGKKIQKRGYIHLNKLQIEEFLNIKKVAAVRLSIHIFAELYKKSTQKKVSGGKSDRTYKIINPVCTLFFSEIKRICGQYFKYKNLIYAALQPLSTLFDSILENDCVKITYKNNFDYNTYYTNKEDEYYTRFNAEFKNELDNINLEIDYTVSNAKMQRLDLVDELIQTLVKESFTYGFDFVKASAANIFSHFLSTTDRLQKPAHYVVTALTNEQKKKLEQDAEEEKNYIEQRKKWRIYKQKKNAFC